MLAMALGLFVLLWILFVLFKNGLQSIDWAMFTQSTPAPGSEGGGLANAIVGSLMMVAVTALVSTPIGILAGVYLAEYGDQSKTASVTRFVTDIMFSAPSIVLGLFVYAIWVAHVKHFSCWAGSIALSLNHIPWSVRSQGSGVPPGPKGEAPRRETPGGRWRAGAGQWRRRGYP